MRKLHHTIWNKENCPFWYKSIRAEISDAPIPVLALVSVLF